MAHGFNANGEADIDLTGADLVRNVGHGHESAGAKPVDHLDGHGFWKASSEGSTTRMVDRIGCQNGANTNVTHARGVDVAVSNGLLQWFGDASNVS